MGIPHPIHLILPRLTLAVLTLAAAAAPSVARAQEPERPLAALAFMAGCWRGEAGVDKSIEEQWTAADSDVMLATTRYVDGNTGRTRGWEFSRIVADSAGITLFPAPGGTQQGRFRMTASPRARRGSRTRRTTFPGASSTAGSTRERWWYAWTVARGRSRWCSCGCGAFPARSPRHRKMAHCCGRERM